MSSDLACEMPTTGTSYPITLGDTFLSDKPIHSYCSVRYDFKPASAGRFRQGSLTMQENQVVVNLPDATASGADMSFSGRHEQSRDGLDCAAIFDGGSWRLELVQGLVKGLKATRRAGRMPTPPPHALQRGASADAELAADDMAATLADALEEDDRSGALPHTARVPAVETQVPKDQQPSEAMDEEEPDQEAAEEDEKEPDQAISDTASPSPRAQAPGALAGGEMSEMEREFMRAPDESSDESDDDDEALNQCSDDDSELAPEDF